MNMEITTRDKLMGVLVSVAAGAVVTALQIGFSGGQTVKEIDTLKNEVQDLKVKVADTVNIKTDVAVLKNDISYIRDYIEELRQDNKKLRNPKQ